MGPDSRALLSPQSSSTHQLGLGRHDFASLPIVNGSSARIPAEETRVALRPDKRGLRTNRSVPVNELLVGLLLLR